MSLQEIIKVPGLQNALKELGKNPLVERGLTGWTLGVAGAVPTWAANVIQFLDSGGNPSRADLQFETEIGCVYRIEVEVLDPSVFLEVYVGISTGDSRWLVAAPYTVTGVVVSEFISRQVISHIRFNMAAGSGNLAQFKSISIKKRTKAFGLRRITRSATSNGGWGPRDGARLVYLNGVVFMFGGWSGQLLDSDWADADPTTNQVWRTTDLGKTWTRIKNHANNWAANHFTQRHAFPCLTYNNEIYFFGGDTGLANNGPLDGAIIKTSDGINFTRPEHNYLLNGYFDRNVTSWYPGGGANNTLTWIDDGNGSGSIRATSNVADGAYFWQTISVVSGRTYQISWTAVDGGANSRIPTPYIHTNDFVTVRYDGSAGGPWVYGNNSFTWTAANTENVNVWWYGGSSQPIGNHITISECRVKRVNLITNGTFDSTTTGWTPGGANTLSVVSQRCRSVSSVADGAWFHQSFQAIAGETYIITYETFSDGTSLVAYPNIGTGAGSGDLYDGSTKGFVFGTNTFTWRAASTATVFLWFYAGSSKPINNYILIDNVSITIQRNGPTGVQFGSSVGELNGIFSLVCGQTGNTAATAQDEQWFSEDRGENWGFETDGNIGARCNASPLVKHNGKLFLIGGGAYDDILANRTEFNDVWMSDDGYRWNQVLANGHGQFPTGTWPMVFSFKGKLWISTRYNKATDSNIESTYCSSDDGATWQPARLELPPSHADGYCVTPDGVLVATGNWALSNGAPANISSPTWFFR